MYGPVMFERRTARRIHCRGARGSLSGLEVRLLDLSLEGLAVEASLALAVGQEVAIHLSHPLLEDLITITARAVWCCLPQGLARPHIGMLFPSVTVEQRAALRRYLAAEAGSCVFADEELLGFVLASAERVWTVFGPCATKVALINRDSPGRYQLCVGHSNPRQPPAYGQAESLAKALALTFGVPALPRTDPPLREGRAEREPSPPPREVSLQPWERWAAEQERAKQEAPKPASAPKKPPPPPPPKQPPPKPKRAEVAAKPSGSLLGSCVRFGGAVVGYVALTGQGVWSLYDADMTQIGVLSRKGTGYTVYWLGETPESSVAFVGAESFPGALAVAFELDDLPQLNSAPICPRSRSQEAPETRQRAAWGSRVIFRKRLVGYVCESAMDDSWTLLSKAMEQIALLSRDDFPPYKFRVVLMGSSVEDSMEYIVQETFEGAVTAAFNLPALPLIDPPLEIPPPPA